VVDLNRGLLAQQNRQALAQQANDAENAPWGWGPGRGSNKKRVDTARAANEEQYQTGLLRGMQEQQLATDQAMPAAQQGLLAGVGASGYDKSTGALGGADQYLSAATSAQDLATRQQQVSAVSQDRRFNPAQQAAYEFAQEAQQIEAQAQQMEREGGRYGSQLSVAEFAPLRDTNIAAQRGVDRTQFLMDIVGNTTPAQLSSRAMADARGRAKTAVYGLYSTVQSISESKASTLRDAERKAIDDFLGGPDKFFKGLMSQDAATIAKLKSIQELVQQDKAASRVGLDYKTNMLLDEASAPNAEYHGFTVPEGANIRAPQGVGGITETIDNPAGTNDGGIGRAVEGLSEWWSNPQGLER
jgi:hypothetical protein